MNDRKSRDDLTVVGLLVGTWLAAGVDIDVDEGVCDV